MAKLTNWQKTERKQLKARAAMAGALIYWFPGLGVCVVAENLGNTVQAAASRCAPDDKARRKVGEFIALQRWADGRGAGMLQAFDVLGFDAYEFAGMVSAGDFDEKGRALSRMILGGI